MPSIAAAGTPSGASIEGYGGVAGTLAEDLPPREDEACLGVLVERRDHRPDAVAVEDVVGVEELDQVAAGARHRLPHRRRLAAVGFVTEGAQARVALGGDDRGRRVAGAVVDDHQLEVREVLVPDRVERLLQVRLRLVGGDADRNPRRHVALRGRIDRSILSSGCETYEGRTRRVTRATM